MSKAGLLLLVVCLARSANSVWFIQLETPGYIKFHWGKLCPGYANSEVTYRLSYQYWNRSFVDVYYNPGSPAILGGLTPGENYSFFVQAFVNGKPCGEAVDLGETAMKSCGHRELENQVDSDTDVASAGRLPRVRVTNLLQWSAHLISWQRARNTPSDYQPDYKVERFDGAEVLVAHFHTEGPHVIESAKIGHNYWFTVSCNPIDIHARKRFDPEPEDLRPLDFKVEPKIGGAKLSWILPTVARLINQSFEFVWLLGDRLVRTVNAPLDTAVHYEERLEPSVEYTVHMRPIGAKLRAASTASATVIPQSAEDAMIIVRPRPTRPKK